MDTFWGTLQITLGILAPLLAAGAVFLGGYLALGLLEYFRACKALKLEELRRAAPYDDVVVTIRLDRKNAWVTFLKNHEVIWEGEALKEGDGPIAKARKL